MRKALTIAAALALAPFATAVAQMNPPLQGNPQMQGPGPSVPLYLGPDAIGEIQERLSDLGYDPGQVDGVWSPQTASALQAYQQAIGLPPTGHVDLVTLRALGAPSEFVQALFGGAAARQPAGGLTPQPGQPSGGQPGTPYYGVHGQGGFNFSLNPTGQEGFTFQGHWPGGRAYAEVGRQGITGNFKY